MLRDFSLLKAYRYTSLFITSIFYFITAHEHSIFRRVFIVSCMFLSCYLLIYLYSKTYNSKLKIKLLVLIETLGNSLILIPSGGLSSPYVWYSLNSLLVSSFLLSPLYCWANLVIYLISSTFFTRYLLIPQVLEISTIKENANLILSYVLITGIIQLLVQYSKQIDRDRANISRLNNELVKANSIVKDSLNYTIELYHLVNCFSQQKSETALMKLIINYTKKISKSNAFILSISNIKAGLFTLESENIDEQSKLLIFKRICDYTEKNITHENLMEVIIKDKPYIITPIKTDYYQFCFIGIEKNIQENMEYVSRIEQLKLLAQLTSIMLDKLELERMNKSLLINEEQNRIANEIHDNVLQKLFSASCGIYGVIKNLGKGATNKNNMDLILIREIINTSMKDLRTTIYGLSWNKYGRNTFIDDIKKLLTQTEILNRISTELVLIGNHEYLSTTKKTSLYRIISESIGNSVRHGKASHIKVELIMEREFVALNVIDNGTGFNVEKINSNISPGIGLKNVKYLVELFNGVVEFKSALEMGTSINIRIPNTLCIKEEEAI